MLAPAWHNEPKSSPREALETLANMMCEYYPDMSEFYTTALIELNRSPQNIPIFCKTIQDILGDFLKTALDIADTQARHDSCDELKADRAMIVHELKKLEKAINTAQGKDETHTRQTTQHDALMMVVRCG